MKALLLFLTLACAGLGTWAWLEYTWRTRLEQELAAAKVEHHRLSRVAVLGKGLQSGVVTSESGPTGLSEKAKELGIDLEEKEPEKKSAKTKKAPGEKSTAPEAPDLTKMLTDPSVRDSLRAETEAYLEFEYRDLFDLMNLDGQKREEILAVLKERSARQSEVGLSVLDPKLSAADRDKASAEYAKFNAGSEAKLREILGDNYLQFERFEKSGPEREHLKMLSSMLKEKNIPLDKATESRLMDAMYNTRKEFRFDHDLGDSSGILPNDLSQEMVDRYVQQSEELQRQVQARVKEILTPEQFELFVKSQADQQQTTQMGLQFLRKVTGSGKAADARN